MRIRSRLRWSVVAMALGTSVALSAATGSAASPGPAQSAGAGATPDVPSAVRVLDAGMEPRSPLRYVFQPGQSDVMSIDMQMTLQVTSDEITLPATVIPPMHMEASFLVGDVSPDGTARYDFHYTAAEVAEAGGAAADVVAHINEGLAGLVGVSGWVVMTDRGLALEGGFTGLDALDATTRALMDDAQRSVTQMSAVLPEEPVGVGAQWVVEQHLPSQGIVVDQTATYTLEGREGDVLHLSLDIAQSTQPGPIDLPGAPGDATASVVELTGVGNGTMLMSLRDLVPTSHVTSQSHSVLEVSGTQVTSDTTVSAQIGPGATGPTGSAVPAGTPSETPFDRSDY